MGFNTWNTFGEVFNEKMIMEIADAMADRGFRDAGYKYLVIDDNWNMEYRDPETDKMIPRPKKFPDSNIVPTFNYIHDKGLKVGIYSCAGVRTCACKMSSYDYEFLDANTFAEWGVDYLKHDFCLHPELGDGELLYRRMSLALRHCGRDILFNACNWGWDDVWSWARAIGVDTYRSTGDICDNFTSFKNIFQSQVMKLGSNAPGCFNDMDMMTVGMEGKGSNSALFEGTDGGSFGTEGTYRIQFCVWCMFQSPLIMGCDVRTVSDKYRDLLCNPDLIAINQDLEGRPAFPVSFDNNLVYCKLLADGTFALLFINADENERMLSCITHDIGYTVGSGYKIHMKDLLSGEEMVQGDFPVVTVPGRDCRIFKCKLVKD